MITQLMCPIRAEISTHKHLGKRIYLFYLLRGSRDLFVPRYDSFPMNPEKKDTHSLNSK